MKNEIIEKYKACWENHDLSLLEELFHSDIIYQEKVNTIFYGKDKLKEYWISNSKKQRGVEFSAINYIEKESDLVIHWEANFYHIFKSKHIYIEGIMWIKVMNGKIVRLTEFFELKDE